ncbi:MAG: DEAD/DEAH box helicase [Deltaproteobacteria bacterium]|nr:DEAD/DEAH box helicase [Deltaproteobacteria bacterium]
MHAIFDLGFQYCTPVQAEILPAVLAGKDATGKAQTGTGKTAAFLISIFTRMLNDPLAGKRRSGTPRVLILAPTRELAIQITDEAMALSRYCRFNILSVFGGMDYEKQRRQLRGNPVDILVATPGRLLDFQRQRDLHLNQIEVLIIDEADRLLDMGFIPDVRRIIHSTPPRNKRQTMFFSATLKPEVVRLAAQWTRDAVRVEIEPEQVAADSVNQMVYITTSEEKGALLYNIITRQNLTRVIVFCNRRDETRRLTEFLQRYGIRCAMISGEIAQNKRIKTLEGFRAGDIRVMVATDVAGRGIHIDAVSHVINYTLPHDPEDYVHRIGRTGRAGATGTSISFACEDDSFYIPDIETFLGDKLNCIQPDENWLILPEAPKRKAQRPEKSRGDRGRRSDHQNRRKSGRRPNRPQKAV